MYKCKICGKEFPTGRALGGHNALAHKRYRLDKIVIRKQCLKCGKEFEIERTKLKNGMMRIKEKEKKFCSSSCANSHVQTTEQNEARSKKLKGELSSSWKGGICSQIKKCEECGKVLSRQNKSGYCSKCIRQQDFYKKKLSRSIKGKTGGMRVGAGIGKSGWYKGYWCDSSWELAFVIYNLENGIEFERNKQGFEYKFKGEMFKYYPDFLMEDGSYIEVKGYMDKKNEAKHQQFKGVLKVLEEDDMTPYLKYTINKYGKDFIKLYE